MTKRIDTVEKVESKEEPRWYDDLDLTERSTAERLFYCFVAAPYVHIKYGVRERKGLLRIENLESLRIAIERTRKTGRALVVVSNHLDLRDTFVLPYAIDKIDHTFCYKIGKLELFDEFMVVFRRCGEEELSLKKTIEKLQETRFIMLATGVRPIDRNAIKRDYWVIERLVEAGKVILAFPTGTRDKDAPINVGMPQIIHNLSENCLVIPVELKNTDKMTKDEPAVVTFKDHFDPMNFDQSRHGIHEIMQEIAFQIGAPMPLSSKERREKRGIDR